MTTRPSTTSRAIYEIDGRIVDALDRGAVDTLAEAHRRRARPRCLCRPEGTPMYVARLGEGFIVKRMPETGGEHAPGCASHGAHVESDDGNKHRQAKEQERPEDDTNTIDLAFPLTAAAGQPTGRPSRNLHGQSTSRGLSLDALLRLLWDQAGLNEWHPAFARRRTWAVVRWRLLKAAAQTLVRKQPLSARLYVPEPFFIDHRDAINARRLAQWQQYAAAPGKPQPLMLLVGEVKAILPDGQGFKAVVKHLPDQAFGLDEQTFLHLERRFRRELAIWTNAEDIHMLMIATFSVGPANVPSIHELSLMPVTRYWLPIERASQKLPRIDACRMITNYITCA